MTSLLMVFIVVTAIADNSGETPMNTRKPLTLKEERVIRNKGTEAPFSGMY